MSTLVDTVELKQCSVCGKLFPFSFFYRDKFGYYHPKCSKCESESKKQWRENNKERAAMLDRRYKDKKKMEQEAKMSKAEWLQVYGRQYNSQGECTDAMYRLYLSNERMFNATLKLRNNHRVLYGKVGKM